MAHEETSEFNKRKSCTHVSCATVEPSNDPEDPEGTQMVSHFCFPFDYQFLAMEELSASKRPYLLFQVNSVDDWNRHRIEGYGFLRLPIQPGYHELEVETWRPRGSLMSEVHSFFLGGSVRVMRVEELVRTRHFDENGRADIVNRFGLETEDAGRVRVNLNVCWQSKAYHKQQRLDHNVRKHKELLETKKRVNEFKLRQMKLISEQVAEGEHHDHDDLARGDLNEFDPRSNDQMIKTNHGMQVRYHPR